MSIARFNGSGGLTYLAANATGEAGNYLVTFDFMKYLVETVVDDASKKELGLGRIGVGLRMTASIRTQKAGINLGSLLALGVAAQTGSLQGTLTVEVIGIDSPDVGNLFATNSTIDETSIQKTLEALAAIKAKLADPGTTLTPQIVSVKSTDPKVTPVEVRSGLTK